jgi:hypothetical protein
MLRIIRIDIMRGRIIRLFLLCWAIFGIWLWWNGEEPKQITVNMDTREITRVNGDGSETLLWRRNN